MAANNTLKRSPPARAQVRIQELHHRRVSGDVAGVQNGARVQPSIVE